MARLSVNLNKIALLRNSRRTGVPDLRAFARTAVDAGARGITVHPRPDERHIRRSDVPMLAETIAAFRPQVELNIEGYPDNRLLQIAAEVRPEQCTLVPDSPDAFTSEEGWKLGPEQMALVQPAVAKLKSMGARVILFIDPEPTVLDRISACWGGRRGNLYWLVCRGISRWDSRHMAGRLRGHGARGGGAPLGGQRRP